MILLVGRVQGQRNLFMEEFDTLKRRSVYDIPSPIDCGGGIDGVGIGLWTV